MTTQHTALVPSSGNRGFLFLSPSSIVILNSSFDSTRSLSLSPSPSPSPSVCSHTGDITQLLSGQISIPPYSSLVAHILIWTFHSANIDKAWEIESTQLSITTFPVLSTPLISALWMESQSHSYLCTWGSSISSTIALSLANPSHTHCLWAFFFFLPPPPSLPHSVCRCTGSALVVGTKVLHAVCCAVEGVRGGDWRKVWISNSWI